MSRRRIEVLRAAWGAALLVRPGAVLAATRAPVDTRGVVVARVLGARHLVQATLSGARPSPEVLALGAWVDGVHSATAVGLAAIDRRRARVGLLDAAVAGTWSAAGLRDLARGGATAPQHERRRDALARAVLEVVPGGGRLLTRVNRARGSGDPDRRAR